MPTTRHVDRAETAAAVTAPAAPAVTDLNPAERRPLLRDSVIALEQIAISEHDPRRSLLDATGERFLAFDADVIGHEDIARYAVSSVITWLMSDESDEQLAAALLRLRAGDLDLTGARERVREVLDVLYEVLEHEYPMPS